MRPRGPVEGTPAGSLAGHGGRTESLAGRWGRHLRLAARSSASSAAAALVVGVLLRFVVPVSGAWLAGAAAGGVALAGLLCIAIGRSKGPGAPRLRALRDAEAAVEALGTAEQLGHAFLRAALVLAGFALGLWLAGLAGLGRA